MDSEDRTLHDAEQDDDNDEEAEDEGLDWTKSLYCHKLYHFVYSIIILFFSDPPHPDPPSLNGGRRSSNLALKASLAKMDHLFLRRLPPAPHCNSISSTAPEKPCSTPCEHPGQHLGEHQSRFVHLVDVSIAKPSLTACGIPTSPERTSSSLAESISPTWVTLLLEQATRMHPANVLQAESKKGSSYSQKKLSTSLNAEACSAGKRRQPHPSQQLRYMEALSPACQ
jgi:hypothetical protein